MRISIALDCRDANLLAPFWCAAMNYRMDQRLSQYVVLVPADEVPGPVFILQEVAEGKLAKNRMHIDVHPENPKEHIVALEALGAQRRGNRVDEFGMRWQPMADPEGNEFCVAMHTEAADQINIAD